MVYFDIRKVFNYIRVFRLELFADRVTEKGCPLPNCFGFIDGTHIEGGDMKIIV